MTWAGGARRTVAVAIALAAAAGLHLLVWSGSGPHAGVHGLHELSVAAEGSSGAVDGRAAIVDPGPSEGGGHRHLAASLCSAAVVLALGVHRWMRSSARPVGGGAPARRARAPHADRSEPRPSLVSRVDAGVVLRV